MKRLEQGDAAQPLGWIERRESLRVDAEGDVWRKVVVEFDKSIVDAKRLEVLRELEIDMLDRFELYDYLEWIGSETDTDIGDMYQMYLGYTPGGGEAEG